MTQPLAPAAIEVTSLHQAGDLTAAVADAQAVFVGGGNSFRLLRTLSRSTSARPSWRADQLPPGTAP
jgi:dipeptidase E